METQTSHVERGRSDSYVVVDPPAESLTADIIDPDALPPVSMCIPTYNSEDALERCLRSITAQTYPEIELLVIDGGSEDETVSIARRFADTVPPSSKPLESAGWTGLEHLTGDPFGQIASDSPIADARQLYRDRYATAGTQPLGPTNRTISAR